MEIIAFILMFVTEVAQLLCSFFLCALMFLVAEKEVKKIEEKRKTKGE